MTWQDIEKTLSLATTVHGLLTSVVVGTVVWMVRWFRRTIEDQVSERAKIEALSVRLGEVGHWRENVCDPAIDDVGRRLERLEIRVQSHVDDDRERRLASAIGGLSGAHRPLPYGRDP